jgi:hypothetical protein
VAEDLVFDLDPAADEGVALDLAPRADHGIALDLDKPWAAVVLAYLRRHRELELPTLRHNGAPIRRLLVAAGVALIVVGYASFLVTEEIYFTSAGIDNRVNIVAAIGVAVLALGLVLRATQSLPARRQEAGLAVGLALLAATGTLITSTLADYWVAARARQDEVVPKLIRALPPKLQDATVVLDGVCPEIGPGVVFAAAHDLAGVLRSHYKDPAIQANVATTGLVGVESHRLVITAVLPWRPIPLSYPFGHHLSSTTGPSVDRPPSQRRSGATVPRGHSATVVSSAQELRLGHSHLALRSVQVVPEPC